MPPVETHWRSLDRSRSGLGLMDLLVAMAILSSAIIPVSLVLTSGPQTVRGAREASGAELVARRTLEELRAYPLDRLGDYARQVKASPDLAVGPVSYRRFVTLRDLGPRSGLRATLAWVRVDWTRDSTRTLSFEVGTVLSDVR